MVHCDNVPGKITGRPMKQIGEKFRSDVGFCSGISETKICQNVNECVISYLERSETSLDLILPKQLSRYSPPKVTLARLRVIDRKARRFVPSGVEVTAESLSRNARTCGAKVECKLEKKARACRIVRRLSRATKKQCINVNTSGREPGKDRSPLYYHKPLLRHAPIFPGTREKKVQFADKSRP